jgi:hypothetical protein
MVGSNTQEIRLTRGYIIRYPKRRNIITGARLKKEGVRRGIPDLFLAVPKNGYSGLFIEMKTPSGKLSAEQDARIGELMMKCYECVVCRSFDAAKWEIETYLKSGDAL